MYRRYNVSNLKKKTQKLKTTLYVSNGVELEKVNIINKNMPWGKISVGRLFKHLKIMGRCECRNR